MSIATAGTTMTAAQRVWQAFLSPRYPLWLLGIFLAWFAVWAIQPSHPKDFFLEHVMTVLFVLFLGWSYRRFRLSHISYTTIFVFMCLHVVGAHYTYSEVPYDEWSRVAGSWLGFDNFSINRLFGFERNHYDRLVHFSFGLTMAYPVREVFIRLVHARGFWGYYLPLDVMMSFSMLYELIEWAVAVFVGGDVGQSYLGTQGDEWDAHKDMALATLGGLITMSIAALVNWWADRDFAAEMAASFRTDASPPLGEVKLAELMKEAADEE